MKSIAKGLCAAALLGYLIAGTSPALALSASLAIKCRQMALAKYPPTRPGVKHGTAAEERTFYRDCISHNGVMPEDDVSGPAAPPSKK